MKTEPKMKVLSRFACLTIGSTLIVVFLIASFITSDRHSLLSDGKIDATGAHPVDPQKRNSHLVSTL